RSRRRVGEEEAKELATALRQSARTVSPSPHRHGPVYKGRVTIRADVSGRGIQLVKFLLDGHLRAIINVPPYSWEWDTRTSPNGEHVIEIEGLDLTGKLINRTTSHVVVEN